MKIDVPIKILFGDCMILSFDPVGCRFSSKDVKAAPIYLRNIYKYILCQISHVELISYWRTRNQTTKEVEKVDEKITAGYQQGEKKCNQHSQEYWIIKTVHMIQHLLVIWHILKHKKKQKLNIIPLINWAQTAGLPGIKKWQWRKYRQQLRRFVHKWSYYIHNKARKRRGLHILDCLHLAPELSQDQKASII